MERRLFSILALLTAVLSGCGRAPESETIVPTPMPTTLSGVYSGQLPCSNCAAIVATLWLRPDGRFFLRQEFTDEGGDTGTEATGSRDHSAIYALGRWRWDAPAAEAVLHGAGPERRLTVLDTDRLQLRVASPIEHVLTRDASPTPFGDRARFDGESAVTERGATFRECLTGLSLVVAESGAFRDLRRQHRQMNPRGKVALTTVEGHLVTVTDGSTTSEQLVVDRLIAIKPGTGCSP